MSAQTRDAARKRAASPALGGLMLVTALASIVTFAGAYLVVWALFSLVVTAVQLELRALGWLTPGMSTASVWLSKLTADPRPAS